ncbi:MAG: hypothetical protein GC190_15545 [Alphaproteobacteria bacterium]|jgi:hypothetical protein|nr:hypothetical protein [Alphaproteobacteria bacterium]
MSQARREQPRSTDSVFPEGTAAFSDAIAGSFQTMFKTMSDLQQHYLQFATHRLEKNAEAASEFLRCKSWEDIAALQQSWAKQVSDEYAQHFAKLAEVTQNAMQNGAAQFDNSAKRQH